MDNSMSINLEQGNNSMNPSLSFSWIAIFNDGTKINQYEENGIENKFQLVKDRFNELGYFNLTNKEGKLFTVDLINGLIGYNYLALPYIEVKEKKENVRLIFFRRHRVTLNQEGKEIEHILNYHLGFQYNDKNGYNQKIVLKIDEEGNFIIE